MQIIVLIVTHCIQCNLFPKQLLHCYSTYSTQGNSLHLMQLISKATLALSATPFQINAGHYFQFIWFNKTHNHSQSNSCTHSIQSNSFWKWLLHSVQLIPKQLLQFSATIFPINATHYIQFIWFNKTHSHSQSNSCTHYNSLHSM